MGNNSTAVNSMGSEKNSAGNWDKGESTDDREDRAQSEETSGGRSSSGPPDEDARSTTSADSGVGSQEIATANNGPGGGGQQQQQQQRVGGNEMQLAYIELIDLNGSYNIVLSSSRKRLYGKYRHQALFFIQSLFHIS